MILFREYKEYLNSFRFKHLNVETMKNKSLIVTITVVTALSLGILTGCGAYQSSNSDPLTNSTQIEQTSDTEGGESTQEFSETTQETSQEATDTNEIDTTKPSSESEEPTEDNQETAHVHSWETKTITEYTTETVTVVDKPAWDEPAYDETAYREETTIVHHDAVTHIVHHDAEYGMVEADGFQCDCGNFQDHYFDCPVCHGGTTAVGYVYGLIKEAYDEVVVDQAAWDETVTTQVPYTIHHDAVHHEAQTHTELQQVPHTREITVCSVCKEEKK